MTIRGHPESTFKQMIDICVKFTVYGIAAAGLVSFYQRYLQQRLTDVNTLSFYEYRRILLNEFCGKSHADADEDDDCDTIRCSVSYVQRLRDRLEGKEVRHRNLTVDSYEVSNLAIVKLQDSFINFEAALMTGALFSAVGILAYLRLYRPFLRACPPKKLLVTYWAHRGARVEPRLFGLYKERSFEYRFNDYEAAVFDPKCLPKGLQQWFASNLIQHKESLLSLDPISFEINTMAITKDGKHIHVIAELQVEPEIAYTNRYTPSAIDGLVTSMLDLSESEKSQRCESVVDFELKHFIKEMPMDHLQRDPGALYCFCQQIVGKTLKSFFDLRVVHCRSFHVFDEDETFNIHRRNLC